MAPWIPLVAAVSIVGVVLFSRYQLATLERTAPHGLQIDMHKDQGRHWYKHLHKPGELPGDDSYLKLEAIAAGVPGFYPDRSGSPPLLIHTAQDKTFEVIQGQFGYEVDGKPGTLAAGESVKVPRGAAHTFWNASPDDEVSFTVRLEPGLDAAAFYETFSGVMRDMDRSGRAPNPMELVAIFHEYKVLMAEIPDPLRGPFHAIMHKIAPLFGYKFAYSVYEAESEAAFKARGGADAVEIQQPAEAEAQAEDHDEL